MALLGVKAPMTPIPIGEACDCDGTGAEEGSHRKCDPAFFNPPAKRRRCDPLLEPSAESPSSLLTPKPPDDPPPFRLWAAVHFNALDLDRPYVLFEDERFQELSSLQLELFRYRWHAFATACVRMNLDENSQEIFFHGCWLELHEWGPDGATELVQLMLARGILQSK